MTGNGILDKVLMALNVALGLAAAGILVYRLYFYDRPLPTNEQGIEEMGKINPAQLVPETFKLEPLIINLPSETRRLRFLNASIELVPRSIEKKEYFEENRPLIRDAIIDISSKMTPRELNTVAGKIILENRIKTRLETILGPDQVREVLFTKFVVQ